MRVEREEEERLKARERERLAKVEEVERQRRLSETEIEQKARKGKLKQRVEQVWPRLCQKNVRMIFRGRPGRGGQAEKA